jgi:AbrB family looped-hinge helix DNA binding protein
MTPTMGAKGQVVIPEELREQTGLRPGDDVAFDLLDDGILVRRAGEPTPLRGRFGESGMAARLLADRRREAR